MFASPLPIIGAGAKPSAGSAKPMPMKACAIFSSSSASSTPKPPIVGSPPIAAPASTRCTVSRKTLQLKVLG